MAAIPTILKGDDSGSISLTLASGYTYTGATLAVAYQGVTRTFTNLTAGGSVSLAFTHDETANFELGCKPLLVRLIGSSGAIQTVVNADLKIKVTDALSEVSAGGSFTVTPGSSPVPLTDVGDLAAGASIDALYAKVNEIVRVLAQRSLLALALCLGGLWSGGALAAEALTARLGALSPDSLVVTNAPSSSDAVGGLTTNAVCAIVTNDVRDITVGTRFACGQVYTNIYDDVTYCVTNVAVRWNGTCFEMHIVGQNAYSGEIMNVDGWYRCALTNEFPDPYTVVNTNINSDATSVYIGDKDVTGFSQNLADALVCRGDGTQAYTNNAHNALGLAYAREIVPTVTGTVTKAYVEGLGITSGGASMPAHGVVLTNALLKTTDGTTITAANVSGAQTAEDVENLILSAGLVTTNSWVRNVYGTIGKQIEWLSGLRYTVWGVDYAVYAKEAQTAGSAEQAEKIGIYALNTRPMISKSFGFEDTESNDPTVVLDYYDFDGDVEVVKTNAYVNDITAATNAALTQAAAAYYPKAQGEAWSTYWDGDDVRVTVTNYDSAVNLPALYLEQRTNETTAATAAFRTVWDEMQRWNRFTGTNFNWNAATWTGFESWAEGVEADIADKADRAWGFYDSHTGEYAPDGTTQISSSNIIIAANMGYQKNVTTHGDSYWVLTANEPFTYNGTTNGYFQIQDSDGNVQFEIVKGDKRTVAAHCGGVSVSDRTLIATYAVVADQHPTIQVCADLSETPTWYAEDSASCPATVTWSGSSGAYVARVTPTSASATKIFVRATYVAGGETYVRNNCAVGMSKIVLNGTTYVLGTATISGHTVLTLTAE